jgi:hypothetical protein
VPPGRIDCKSTALVWSELQVKSNLSTAFSTFDSRDLPNRLKIRHIKSAAFWRFACSGKGMLKISIRDRKAGRLLVLEGKLVAPWTKELTETASQNHVGKQELVVDVRGVTDISADGEEALYCLMVRGTKFRGAGVFIKQILKQLAQRVRRDRSV